MADLLFEIEDKDGWKVRLGRGRWELHIVDKHPEVEAFLEEIKKVIRSPQVITQDRGKAYHLSRLGVVGGKWRKLYLEVIVRYSEGQSPPTGSVLTVYFNALSPKGDLKWIEPK